MGFYKTLLFAFWPDRYERIEAKAARGRWLKINEENTKNCTCGKPATSTISSSWGPAMGGIVPQWGRCNEHAHVSETTPWADFGGGNRQPMVQRADGVWFVEA